MKTLGFPDANYSDHDGRTAYEAGWNGAMDFGPDANPYPPESALYASYQLGRLEAQRFVDVFGRRPRAVQAFGPEVAT